MSGYKSHMHRYEHDSEIGDGAWRLCTVTQRLEMVHGDSEIGHGEIGYGAYLLI